MPSPPDNRRPLAQSGLADAVHSALGGKESIPALDTHVPRGGTIHLGAEYLAYARMKLSPLALKKELESRLAPIVAKSAGPEAGKPFGKFLVKSFLGKGGMAEVFLAQDPERDPAKGQDVALKVMREDIAGEPTYIRRFLREAANAGLIDHSNVVAIHEVGAVAGRVYFTMELVQGQTLKERLACSGLGEAEGLEILRQITSGLVAAHQRGIGHRDLKPSNIMLADASQKYGFTLAGESATLVKIMDFGLARMYADDDEPEVDAEGRILGTAKYVAPELIEGKTPSLGADVFSLGVMAFQIFSGRAPWKAKNKLEYLEANVRAETPQLEVVAPGVSAETGLLVAAMLQKDPAQRPSMKALDRDVERVIAHRARKAEKPLSVTDDPESIFYAKRSLRKPGSRSGTMAQKQRNAALPALAILGAVALALVLTALLLSGGHPERAEPPPPPPPPELPRDPKQPPKKAEPPSLELVLGRRPSSLSALTQLVPGALEKAQLQKALEAGDQAWADSDPEYARDRWQEALAIAGEAPELKRRVGLAERELALKRAGAFEKDGKVQEALDALDEAEAKGASVAASRERLKARAKDAQAVRDALDEATACIARGEFDAAKDRLDAAAPSFDRLGREAERRAKLDEVSQARARRSANARLDKLLEEARACLDRGELEAARSALDSATAIDANDARIAPLSKRLARLRGTPRGFACVEVDSKKGLYVRREPVSNREYKEWLDSLPIGKRRSAPWLTGSFAPEDADKPVKNVKPDDARAFAEARSERLPTAFEREAIARSLKVAAAEGTLDARGVLGAGFRTVQDPREDKP